MKPEVTLKYLSYLRDKKTTNEGFTLIELLVVVIIIGVLAAVALPNLLGQVGKARETELKNAVGTINRSQQAYHFERQAFSGNLSNLGLKIPTQYITNDLNDSAADGISADASSATFAPTNSNSANDGTRAYSGAIAHLSGTYGQVLCQSDAVANSLTAPTGKTPTALEASDACPTGSVTIR